MRSRSRALWVVRHAGATEPLGYLVLTLGYSVEYGGRDGFIDDLYLAPGLRGRGVGTRLLAFALERAAALGIGTLHLEAEAGNADAGRLYRAAGFEETGRRLMRRRIQPPRHADAPGAADDPAGPAGPAATASRRGLSQGTSALRRKVAARPAGGLEP